MAYFSSLREYLEALDKAGKLTTIKSPINKDTELNTLLYLQGMGVPEEQRKAFFFTNVVDSRGRKYDIPVAHVGGGFAGNVGGVVAISLKSKPNEVQDKVIQAMMHPIEPKVVKTGPVQEVIYKGNRLLEKGGLDELPVPITHPGWDAGPIMGASQWVTKDLKTGIRNVGLYRCHVYAPDRMGIHMAGPGRHITTHWQQARNKGVPMQAAIVIGGPPHVFHVASPPYGVDEYTICGALKGEPLELVKCQTVDLEVPAEADIVIEGELSTTEAVLEGPHGEAWGYASTGDMQPYLMVKCITHRKDAIYLAYGGGLPGTLFKVLRYDLNMPHVLAVGSLPSTAPGGTQITTIKIKNGTPQEEVWRTLEAFVAPSGNQDPLAGAKTVIAVNEDIDIRDTDMVLWAVAGRSEPHRDYRIVKYQMVDLKPISMLPETEMVKVRHNQFDPNQEMPPASRVLINATMKWPYPPVSMPKKEFMERAIAIWKELGLPALELKAPWHGYELGFWPKEYAEDAERAVKGEYYKNAEMRARKKVKLNYPKGGDTRPPNTGKVIFPPEK